MSQRSRFSLLWAALGVVIVVGVVITLAVRPAVAAHPPTSFSIAADPDHCGAGWGAGSGTDAPAATTAPARVDGGVQTFTVTNGTVAGMEVYLQSVDSKKVYLDLEGIGAGAHVTARVALGSGRYRFVCLPADVDPVTGPPVSVGAAPPSVALTPGMVPVTRNDLIPVAKTYGTWVSSRIPVLRKQVQSLSDDVAEGDSAGAKTAWLAAHLTYETLGAAYGAFGDLDTAINGPPAPGSTALNDPELTGFHRVEALLWSGAPATSIQPAVAALATAVAALGAAFSDAEVDPGDIGLRAHEIVENAIQFELQGTTDAGSGTNIATIGANLQGASAALEPLEGILATRYPQLDATKAGIARSQALVQSLRRADGSWPRVASLTLAQRERLDASLSETAELLAPVAAICDIRREP
ncbi:EfeM/EfeO family lipoprotein [Diaminobutyricibacter sp. McL0608]|uniref:EfeM/EfeO family lipoprotein n=1 Tax=Leifsonia sp. McL0608 TaxID=3143537 RepID=UPI0031F2EF8C